jgi:hypothetical protein
MAMKTICLAMAMLVWAAIAAMGTDAESGVRASTGTSTSMSTGPVVGKRGGAEQALLTVMGSVDELLVVTTDIANLDGAQAALPTIKAIRARMQKQADELDRHYPAQEMEAARSAHAAEIERMLERVKAELSRLKAIGVDLEKMLGDSVLPR